MTLKIDLDPGQEVLLLQEAERHGLDANEFVRHLIERSLTPHAVSVRAAATPKDRARAFRAWAESHRLDTAPLSDAAISRETIYGERG